MTIEQIAQSSATMYSGATGGNKSNKTEPGTENGTAKQNTVEDTVALSPAALKALQLQFGTISERAPASVTEDFRLRLLSGNAPSGNAPTPDRTIIEEAEKHTEYAYQKSDWLDSNRDEHRAIIKKWNDETGGLFYGTGFSTDDLSNITTTSGKPHPFAKQIGDYLQNHKGDLERLESLRTEKFPSFEEWKAQNS